MSKRDTQRSAVYKWEQLLPVWTPNILRTTSELQGLIYEAWERFRPSDSPKRAPTLERSKGRRKRGVWMPLEHKILLPKWAHFDCYALHEISHALVPGGQHGPQFVAQYLELMVEFLDLDFGLATSLADNLKPRRVRYEW